MSNRMDTYMYLYLDYNILHYNVLENALANLDSALTNMDGFLDTLLEEICACQRGVMPGEIYPKEVRDVCLKDAVSQLFSGAELMMKASLYYPDRDKEKIIVKGQRGKITDTQFEKGEFKSIQYCEAKKSIKGDEKLKKSVNFDRIGSLQELRNRIEHFEINIPINEVLKRWFRAWEELFVYCDDVMLDIFEAEKQMEKYAVLHQSFLRVSRTYKLVVERSKEQSFFDFQIND